jgi:hypothetical protein
LSEEEEDQTWEISKQKCSFENRKALDRKVFSQFFELHFSYLNLLKLNPK